jgi:hypothetical protein
MGRFSSSEAMEEREVEEAEALGDSTGEPMAVEGEDTSESVVVVVRRSAGFCRGAVAVEPAMVKTTTGLLKEWLLRSFLKGAGAIGVPGTHRLRRRGEIQRRRSGRKGRGNSG